jgi:putative flippase GtrA
MLQSDLERSERRPEEAYLHKLKRRYPGAFQAAKFAIGSAVGFFDTLIILTIGTYLLYGTLSAPHSAFSSPHFIALNILAFVIGVTVAFFINETLIVRLEGRKVSYDVISTANRLGKFQLIFLAGNLVMVAIQLLLLKTFSVPPVLGTIVGAVFAFPISYFFSMRFIWRINNGEFDLGHHQELFQRESRQNSSNKDNNLPNIYLHHDPVAALPERIVTVDGVYVVNVEENRFDIFPTDERSGETKIEFALKVDVSPEKSNGK